MSAACPRCGARPPAQRLDVCPRCLLEAEVPPALLAGRLELQEEIGRGGMGAVYKAHDRALDRIVAVKFLPEELARLPDFQARFEREARALARLSHPHIVAVHDVGSADGYGYIVMEYVDGQPLSEALPLPPARALEVGSQLCRALAYAHRQGVVHRDVKPENVILDARGQAKLTDFGIARLSARAGDRTGPLEASLVMGTPSYMAPEALAGAPADPRMDVYSLGLVLKEMVTGPPRAAPAASLPPALGRIVARAAAADPADRYPTMEEMERDLLAASDGPADALAPDERNWLRAVALLQAFATAVALWALLVSVTPRVIGPDEVRPLVMLGARQLPDGRIVSRARFETWPTLAALAAIALASAAYGALRRHWRSAGLDAPRPAEPVRESSAVLGCGVAALVVYAGRRLVQSRGDPWALQYLPIAGGLIEIAAVFLAWTAVLQAWRTSRPLGRELQLWLGLGLALVPPVVELSLYLRSWQP